MGDLDLLLINPGILRARIYQGLGNNLSAIEPPFWAALTAGFLRRRGHKVEILDANIRDLSAGETSEKIEEFNPSLTNIVVYGQHPSASTQLMDDVGTLCSNIKQKNPKRKIILTGLHPSALPERTILEESCDFVCQGEGVYTLEKLLEGEELERIPGLWWRTGEKIAHTPRASTVQNLSLELDDVAWDLLPDLNEYRAHNWQCLGNLSERGGYASLSTSLGCPHKCDFCSISATFGEHRTRFWSPEWVLKQIDTLVKTKGLRNLKIIDELFTLNPDHFIPIAEGIIERDYNLNIWAYTDVRGKKNPDHLKKLKLAGFNWLCPGIESGDSKVRNENSKKGFNDANVLEEVRKMQGEGINVLGNYIFGLPGEDESSMQRTLDLALDLNCQFANFYCAIAWPGSELYTRVINGGVRLPPRWRDYAQHSKGFVPLPTEKLSPEAILAFRETAFETYFTNPKYLKSISDRFGVEAMLHIRDMTRHKLQRDILY